MNLDVIDLNLRQFALRKAAHASKEFSDLSNKVVVSIQATPNRNCPMHGKNGSLQQHSEHLSRKEMCKGLRMMFKSPTEAFGRSQSLASTGIRSSTSDLANQSFTLPRRMSASAATKSKVSRNASFQEKPVKRDKYTGVVDFKSILRKLDPKEEERSSGGVANRKSKPDLGPMDYHRDSEFQQHMMTVNPYASPKRAFMPPPCPEPGFKAPSRPALTRPNHIDLRSSFLSSKSRSPDLCSPFGVDSNPQSPRRVEFGDEVCFTFSQEDIFQKLNQPASATPAKPILRNTLSEPPATLLQQFEMRKRFENTSSVNELACNDDLTPTDCQPSADTWVQIHVPADYVAEPETLKSDKAESEAPYEPPSVCDDGRKSPGTNTLEHDLSLTQTKIAAERTLSLDQEKKKKVPPFLSDWNRSQSFPPPGQPSHADLNIEPPSSCSSLIGSSSLIIEETRMGSRSNSNMSLASEMEDDMVEHENETLRDRVGDLEKKVHEQNDEITCLRATLADALRRINFLESDKAHVQVNNISGRQRSRGEVASPNADGILRYRHPVSASYSSPGGYQQANYFATYSSSTLANGSTPSSAALHHNMSHQIVSRRASYASNRDNKITKAVLRSDMYQSTGSLHSDDRSSHSVSSAASPSPTQMKGSSRGNLSSTRKLVPKSPPRTLSNSMSNLAINRDRRWGSTTDFRDSSSGPNTPSRKYQMGSMSSLRSPFGSQQNLDRSVFSRHGTKDATYNSNDGAVKLFIRGRPVNLYAPSALIETYSLVKVSPAPHQKLKLEWVYGYRGRDARSNLYLLPTGEMVYFVAAVVVLFNAEEHSQRHYLGHTEDIKCLAIHPNKLIIATGQLAGPDRKDGRSHIRVWNAVSLSTLHVLGVGDFERSVVCVSFSKADGGSFLVAVDEGPDHTMSVWDWQRGHKITESICASETVVAAEFHPLETGTIVSIGKGHVNFWTLDNNSLTLSRKTGLFDPKDKPKYVTCIAFSSTGDVITGDSNGNVFIWGRGYNAVTKTLRKVHNGPIFGICVLKDGSVVTGGGKDGRLVQFDSLYRKTGLEAELPDHLGSIRTISQGKGSQLLIGSTRNSILQGTFELNFHEIVSGHVDEVWALATHPQLNQFLSAGYDQYIHLWDTLTHQTVWSSNIGDQAQCACFSADGEVIALGMLSGRWMVLDVSTREVMGIFQDGHEPIQVVKFSPDCKLLALGTRDGILNVYQVTNKYRKFNRMGRCLPPHPSCLTQLDWSKDSIYLQSNSGDYELLYWNAAVCRQVAGMATIRDVEWASQSCVLGFNTIGVWPETVDGTDLSSCNRSHDHKLLVTGDDVGKIKLYSFPVTQPKSLSHVYGGHSSQVTRVEFLADDSRLISTGGRDTAIMQWFVVSQ